MANALGVVNVITSNCFSKLSYFFKKGSEANDKFQDFSKHRKLPAFNVRIVWSLETELVSVLFHEEDRTPGRLSSHTVKRTPVQVQHSQPAYIKQGCHNLMKNVKWQSTEFNMANVHRRATTRGDRLFSVGAQLQPCFFHVDFGKTSFVMLV